MEQHEALHLTEDHNLSLNTLWELREVENMPALLLSHIRKNDIYEDLLGIFGIDLLDCENPTGYAGPGISFPMEGDDAIHGRNFYPISAAHTKEIASSLQERIERWGPKYFLEPEFLLHEVYFRLLDQLAMAGIPLVDRYCEPNGFIRPINRSVDQPDWVTLGLHLQSKGQALRGHKAEVMKGPMLMDNITLLIATLHQLYAAHTRGKDHAYMALEPEQIAYMHSQKSFLEHCITSLRGEYKWLETPKELRFINTSVLRSIPIENDTLRYMAAMNEFVAADSEERKELAPNILRMKKAEITPSNGKLRLPYGIEFVPFRDLNMIWRPMYKRDEGMSYTPLSRS